MKTSAKYFCLAVRPVAIGNPERHVRKASHHGNKQQYRSCVAISLRMLVVMFNRSHVSIGRASTHSIIACSHHIYVLLFFAHIPFVVKHTINATPPERLQQALGQVIWAKMAKNLPHLWHHSQRAETKKQIFFIADSKTCRVFWGLEQLSNAIG